jgi:hypothetical protein
MHHECSKEWFDFLASQFKDQVSPHSCRVCISSHPQIQKEAKVEFIATSLITFWLPVEAIAKGNELYLENLGGILDYSRMLNTSPVRHTLDKRVGNLSILMQLLIAGYQM